MKCDKCFFCTHIGKGIYEDYPVKYCKYHKIYLLPFVKGRKLDFNSMKDCRIWQETGCNIHPSKVKKAKEDLFKSLAAGGGRMKPLTENEFLAVSDLGNENKFQIVRIQEVMAFWKSGAEAAEIKTSGDVTLGRERELYKKALAQTKLTRAGIEFLQRKGKLYARRKKRDTKMASGLCPCCGGQLSNIRTNGPEPQRHCYSCNFDFPIDADGNARREVEENGDR